MKTKIKKKEILGADSESKQPVKLYYFYINVVNVIKKIILKKYLKK